MPPPPRLLPPRHDSGMPNEANEETVKEGQRPESWALSNWYVCPRPHVSSSFADMTCASPVPQCTEYSKRATAPMPRGRCKSQQHRNKTTTDSANERRHHPCHVRGMGAGVCTTRTTSMRHRAPRSANEGHAHVTYVAWALGNWTHAQRYDEGHHSCHVCVCRVHGMGSGESDKRPRDDPTTTANAQNTMIRQRQRPRCDDVTTTP
ncbi:hypothetical protein K443DRAFT_14367 [Laccaria amethystina LaAM-08-1]|uniref:Unplaced genomic scaffold K443scaffold_468, whole genome shotgun sequence n=1 Tax=Laccaria amethystina LaAM-08-1 TaxID=1095629 RepID=A0A0C9WHM7_9AGAR|nr:hypothetical protein K443DRAFT_14367 [Laccaria amethystina LaAM-08-1]